MNNKYFLPRGKLDFHRSYKFYRGSCLGCFRPICTL